MTKRGRRGWRRALRSGLLLAAATVVVAAAPADASANAASAKPAKAASTRSPKATAGKSTKASTATSDASPQASPDAASAAAPPVEPAPAASPSAWPRPASAERGKQVFALAAGCSCHSTNAGPVGAGGGEIATPFGKFFATNITPDRDTGIGAWTDEEIDAAIRRGRLRDGSAEAPVMPYYRYAGMSDADAADLIAYLRTLAPVARANRPHEGELPLARWSYLGWQFFFGRTWPPPPVAPESGVKRGRYLADHVSLCSDCHTPRTALGAVDRAMYMAGTKQGPGGKPVPNITPDPTGIGGWDAADIVNVLESGMLPNFDNVQGAMGETVDGVGGGPGYKDASADDRRAIADYLLTVAPIANKVDDE